MCGKVSRRGSGWIGSMMNSSSSSSPDGIGVSEIGKA